MEELWRVGLIVALVYGNYRLFKGHVWSVFWALCYNVLSREVKKSHPLIVHPILMGISLFPVLTAMVLPSVLVVVCVEEIAGYLTALLVAVTRDPLMNAKFNELVVAVLEKLILFLEIRREEKLTETLVIVKLLEKIEQYTGEILSGSRLALESIGRFGFFLGMVGCFARMERTPLFYLFRPVPKSGEIVRVFESIVHSLCASSLFNFLCGSGLAFVTNTPLVVTEGLLAAFLSIFPVVPLCCYCLPSLVYLWITKSYGLLVMFLSGAVLQQLLATRMFEFPFKGGSFRSISIALGLSVFGLPGAILGPFLVSSLMLLWVPDEVPARAVRAKSPRATKTMEILRKSK